MKSHTLSLIAGATIAVLLIACAEFAAAQTMISRPGVALSAAAKKSAPARERRVPRQIACTIDGCHPIPPGCHPEAGYNWDGIPTGFDIVVCRLPRGRRG